MRGRVTFQRGWKRHPPDVTMLKTKTIWMSGKLCKRHLQSPKMAGSRALLSWLPE